MSAKGGAAHVYKVGGPALEDPGLLGPLAEEVRRVHAALALRESGYDGIRRVILDEEPPRPSARAETLGGDARDLRGDLDWIIMKALERDRTRRTGFLGLLRIGYPLTHRAHSGGEWGGPGAHVWWHKKREQELLLLEVYAY